MSAGFEVLAPAKINLVLELLGRRPDGYHEIRTVLQTVDLFDSMEIRAAADLRFVCDEPEVPAGEENLVVRAARALAAAVGRDLGADIRLVKGIPPASGLGGGSSDAAAALLGLARLWHLPPEVNLVPVAASLGSDVPFFLQGGTALATGRGVEVTPLPDLPRTFVLIARPSRGLSTADVYGSLDPLLTREPERSTINRFLRRLRAGGPGFDSVRNDLEGAAARLLPDISALLEALRDLGADAATVSGSGSAVFGLFREEEPAGRAREAIAGHRAAARTWLCRTLDARGCRAVRPWGR